MLSTPRLLICALLTLLTLQGCTLKAAVEAPEQSGFISRPELLSKPKNLPFDLYWAAPEVATWLFDTVIIRQVKFDGVDANKWILSAGTFITSEEAYIQRIFDLSMYVQKSTAESFIDRASSIKTRDVKIVEETPHVYYNRSMDVLLSPATSLPLFDPIAQGKRTLLVELSISEITFGSPLLYAGLFAVPVPGIANMSTSVRAPSMVIKARFVDEQSGEVILELADRRFPQLKVIDFNRLVVGYALEEMADSFSEDLALLFFRSRADTIRRRSPISLLPW